MFRISIALSSVALTSAAFAAPIAFQNAVAAKNPALWYKFNESTGATSVINYGSLGPAFNGNVPVGITYGAPTIGGDTGVRFNSVTRQYVESASPAPAAYLGNPTFTAETVVFIDAGTSFTNIYPPFLHWGAPATGRSVYFSMQRSDRQRFYAGFYNGGYRTRCANFREGRWHHVVWTREGGGTQYQGTHVYVDGEEVELEADTSLPGAPAIDVTSTTFRVQRATDLDRCFSGMMDEVVLYPRVLTSAEVRENYLALGATATPPCHADYNSDCAVDLFDYLDFVDVFAQNDPSADYNQDGVVDFFDYLDFLDVFSTGC